MAVDKTKTVFTLVYIKLFKFENKLTYACIHLTFDSIFMLANNIWVGKIRKNLQGGEIFPTHFYALFYEFSGYGNDFKHKLAQFVRIRTNFHVLEQTYYLKHLL